MEHLTGSPYESRPAYEYPMSATPAPLSSVPDGAVISTPTLTPSEVESVRRALGPMASLLACAVAKLYICPRGAAEYTWTGVWGALALIVDRTPPTSKALQIYTLHPPSPSTVVAPPAVTPAATASPPTPLSASNVGLSTSACVFSVQLYECLTYLAPNHLFHTFEVDEGLVGFSFGDTTEAHDFLVKVRAHIPAHGAASAAAAAAGVPATKAGGGKKPGFLSRLFGKDGAITGGSGSGGDGESPPTGGGRDGVSISAPSNLVKHDLPEEWGELFRNAAVIASQRQTSQQRLIDQMNQQEQQHQQQQHQHHTQQ